MKHTWDLLLTSTAEYRGQIEAESRDEAIETARQALRGALAIEMKIERCIMLDELSPEEVA